MPTFIDGTTVIFQDTADVTWADDNVPNVSPKPLLLYDNRFLDGTPSATDTASGAAAANITDLRPFTWWIAASAGTKYLTVDCGTAKAADSVGVTGHNLATASGAISVESSTDNATWTERFSAITPKSDRAFLIIFATATARYWRIKIVTAAVAPKIAVACLGVRMDFERYPAGPFDPAPETLHATQARSKAGHLIGATLANVSLEIGVDFKGLTGNWIDYTFRPVWDAHLSLCKPFFFVWDCSNRHGSEVYFVCIPEGFTLRMPYSPYRRDLSLTMQGIKET